MERLGLLFRSQEDGSEHVHPVPPNPLPGLQPRARLNQLSCKEGGVKGRREATLPFDREDSPIERASIAGNPPCNTPTSGLEVSVS